TGAEKIRAGVPPDWKVADKTGTGSIGTTNTIAVMWPPGRSPIVIAVYFTQSPKQRNDVVAAAARAVVAQFA
ncbi:MAG: class beta-lactamase, partial [Massilia sp.]|nr:class beta-lactamase [Massilia sp.]